MQRSVLMKDVPEECLTGNLRVDFFGQSRMSAAPWSAQESGAGVEQAYKSPWIAAGLSFVLPGAGEYYAESYWKAAAFLAVEVAAWAVAYSYDRKGDRQTRDFENFANQHWNVVRYARFSDSTYASATYDWFIEGRENLPPWEQVNWTELNRMERDIARTPEGQYYSHTLPLWGEQQYYELIGKYQQFYHGWDDADPSLSTYEQIVQRLAAGNTLFMYYSRERGKANDFYSSARTAVTLALVNHVISAADAAWSASRYNSVRVEVGIRTIPAPGGRIRVPSATFTYVF
jgi:hypothetical protein